MLNSAVAAALKEARTGAEQALSASQERYAAAEVLKEVEGVVEAVRREIGPRSEAVVARLEFV